MGTGCQEVVRITGGDNNSGSDVIVGRWKDGRVGTVRTLRPSGGYGVIVYRPKSVVQSPPDVAVQLRAAGRTDRELLPDRQTGLCPTRKRSKSSPLWTLHNAVRKRAANRCACDNSACMGAGEGGVFGPFLQSWKIAPAPPVMLRKHRNASTSGEHLELSNRACSRKCKRPVRLSITPYGPNIRNG